MLFSSAIRALSSEFSFYSIQNDDPWSSFERISALSNGDSLSCGEKNLFVGPYTPELKDLPLNTPMILCGEIEPEFMRSRGNLAIYNQVGDTGKILEALYLLCYREASYERSATVQLMNLIDGNCLFQTFTDELAKILHNPVIIYDAAFKIIAYSDYGCKNDIMFTEHIINGQLSDGFIQSCFRYENNKNSYQYVHSNVSIVMQCPMSTHYTLSHRIRLDEIDIAATILVTAAAEPLTDISFHLTPIAASCISVLLRQDPHYISGYVSKEEVLISELLASSNRQIVADTLRRARALGRQICLPQEYFCAVAESCKGNSLSEAAQVSCLFRVHMPNVLVVPYGSRVVLIFPAEHYAKLSDVLTDEALVSAAAEIQAVICVSDKLESYENLRNTYKQICAAITNARILDVCRAGDVITASHFMHFSLLTQNSHEKLSEQIHPAIRHLKQYDELHDSKLYATLKYALVYNGNISQIASIMFCHKNTVNYRLKKIRELTDIDLHNAMLTHTLLQSVFIEQYLTNALQ